MNIVVNDEPRIVAFKEEVWENLLLQDARFKERIAQARASAKAGRVYSLDEAREEFGLTKKRASSVQRESSKSKKYTSG